MDSLAFFPEKYAIFELSHVRCSEKIVYFSIKKLLRMLSDVSENSAVYI